MKQYKITRVLPNFNEIQMRRGTEAEAKETLGSIKRKWEEVAEMGTFGGGERYTTQLDDSTLTVYQGIKIVDCYQMEETK